MHKFLNFTFCLKQNYTKENVSRPTTILSSQHMYIYCYYSCIYLYNKALRLRLPAKDETVKTTQNSNNMTIKILIFGFWFN